MKLSVNTYCLKEMELGPALDSLAGIGYRWIELVGLKQELHIELTKSSATDIRTMVDRRGLDLAAFYMRPINVHDPEKLEKTLADLEIVIDLADEMNVGRIVFTPLLPREDYDYEKLVAGCHRLARRIGERNITITLENHYNWPLSVEGDYARLVELGLPEQFTFTVDTGHFTAAGTDVPEFIAKYADRITHVHLKDHDGNESCGLGKGNVAFTPIMEALASIEFDGFASVEIEQPNVPTMVPLVEDAFRFCTDTLGISPR